MSNNGSIYLTVWHYGKFHTWDTKKEDWVEGFHGTKFSEVLEADKASKTAHKLGSNSMYVSDGKGDLIASCTS